MNKTNMILGAVAACMATLFGLLVYAIYCDVTNPQPKPQHGSYAQCEYRTVKGACGKWTTKTY